MTRLAIAQPQKTGIGPLMTGVPAQESVSINKWNIDALSVNDKHINPGAITTEKIMVGAVTTVTIADGTITGDKVAAATITGNKIAANTIEGSNIAASTITAGLINVSTLSAITANLGTITAGTLNLVDGGTNTGTYVSPTQILVKKAGVTKVDLNASADTYYFAGTVVTSAITITSGSNSVNFGSSITVGGDLILQDSTTSGYVRFDGASGTRRIGWDSVTDSIFILNADATAEIILQVTSNTAYAGNYIRVKETLVELSTSAGGSTTADMSLVVGTNSGNTFALKRGSTTVMSFNGDSSTVTFGGAVTALTLTASSVITGSAYYLGSIYIYSGSGAPSGGNDGDLYFRTDAPNAYNSYLYQKVAGVWKALVGA